MTNPTGNAAAENAIAERGAAPLAVRLRSLRLAAGLKQATLAKRSGLSQGMISGLESGKRGRYIRYATVQALADALGVTVDDLTRQGQDILQV